jgi:hypothetical protein
MVRRYEDCATRLENRGSHPPTKEYVDNLVEGLLESGVEASWHSAVDPLGMPLFPSKVFPVCHPQASMEAFRYLIDRLHEIGRPVVSWYPLVLGGGVLPAHPEWRIKFYDVEGVTPNPEWADKYACYNSPYGELLPAFAAEVVRDVGFDGLWFDGSTWSHHNTWPMFQPGCACDFCRERFKRETGLDLPQKVDFSERTFRVWLNWRYDVLMDMWRRVVAAVHEVRPDAVICFNNYRRRNPGTFAWNTAIPLRTLDLDMLMSGELDGFPGQADIQMKINRAYRCKRGAESWWPLCDHWHVWVPDIEPLTAVQAALGCISAGGVASMGIGVDAKTVAYALREVESAAAPRMPFAGGETVEYGAILASQQTMDFYATPPDVWDEIHGANEFCRHAHLQSSVIFDDQIERGELERYPVLLIGNAACMSARQAQQLSDCVQKGGVLVACHEVGTRDEMGYPQAKPALDDLLGIRSREQGKGHPTLEIADSELIEACGWYVTFQDGHTLAMPADDVRVLASTVDRTTGSWEGAEEASGGQKAPRHPGMWVRQFGQGYAVYLGVNYFRTYLHAPVPRMMRLLRALLVGLRAPRITLHGPMCVTMNVRAQSDGRWAVHLHNSPGSAYAYPAPPRSNMLHTPGEVVPVRDLVIEVVEGSIRSVHSGISGETYRISEGTRVHVPLLAIHDVVLLEVADR